MHFYTIGLHTPPPSLREVPLPTGRGKARVQTSSIPHKPECIAPSTDAHQALGSPSGRAGAKRLRGLTAPIPPTAPQQIHRTPPWLSLRESWREAPERDHRTDSTHKLPTESPHRFLSRTAFRPPLSAHPSPPPFGRYLSRRERQVLRANFRPFGNSGFSITHKKR